MSVEGPPRAPGPDAGPAEVPRRGGGRAKIFQQGWRGSRAVARADATREGGAPRRVARARRPPGSVRGGGEGGGGGGETGGDGGTTAYAAGPPAGCPEAPWGEAPWRRVRGRGARAPRARRGGIVTTPGSVAPAAGGGLFGGASTLAGGGLFGAPAPASTPAAGGLFGAPAAAASTPAAGGLFGAPAAAASTPAAGGGLFGAPAAAASTPAAGGLFGAPPPLRPRQRRAAACSVLRRRCVHASGGGGLFGAPAALRPRQRRAAACRHPGGGAGDGRRTLRCAVDGWVWSPGPPSVRPPRSRGAGRGGDDDETRRIQEEAKDGYERTPPFHTTRRVEGRARGETAHRHCDIISPLVATACTFHFAA